MSDQTSYLDDVPVLPMPLAPEDLYFMLMGEIEPELLENQKKLDAKYKHETKKERTARSARYKQAFEILHKKYDAYMKRWKALFSQYKRDVNEYIEKWEYIQESCNLDDFLTS